MSTIKTKVDAEVNAFMVPEFATIESHNHATSYPVPLSSLDELTLSWMCDEFRREVFKQAGKHEPPTAEPVCAICSATL
jgi:hypothetical protein